MAPTDAFVRTIKHSGNSSGDKHTDGDGLILLVNAAGKYWRLNYRYSGKQKTLALGVYPEVSLIKARQRREKARELLADGIDPGQAKKLEKIARIESDATKFEVVARKWLDKTEGNRAKTTQDRATGWLERKVFALIGNKPISSVGPCDMAVIGKREELGHIESAHRVMQICGQVFRYAVAIGAANHDVTADLKGALASV